MVLLVFGSRKAKGVKPSRFTFKSFPKSFDFHEKLTKLKDR